MLAFIKFIEIFILKILFNKDEYKITSKNFNPIRVLIITILLFNVFISFYLIFKLNIIYNELNKECPEYIKKKIENQ